jgi:site-specific DNA-cytosine methylase
MIKMGIKVLSLCDGMSCGQIGFEKAGIIIDKYYASEIKQVGIKVTKDNYPNTIHIGDLTKIKYENGILKTEIGNFKEEFDIVIFGSPCQTFSIACKTDKRIGLEDDMKSGLFFECHRILEEVNPKYFLMENVASMRKDDIEFVTEFMGVKPLNINASVFLPALRNRLYWTNIPFFEILHKKNICLNDILENGWSDREKARNLLVSDSRPLTTPVKMFHRYYSTGFTTLIFQNENHYNECVKEYEKLTGGKRKITAKELDNYSGSVFDGVRYMTKTEREKCHGIPVGYTKNLTENEAADVIGDGWAIDVIAHIFSFIK